MGLQPQPAKAVSGRASEPKKVNERDSILLQITQQVVQVARLRHSQQQRSGKLEGVL